MIKRKKKIWPCSESLNIFGNSQIVNLASGASQQDCRKHLSYVEVTSSSSFQLSMLEQELLPSYQRVQKLARRGTNAWAYGVLMCVFMVCTLSVPCCFLINFSNPLAVAKDESSGNPDSTRE